MSPVRYCGGTPHRAVQNQAFCRTGRPRRTVRYRKRPCGVRESFLSTGGRTSSRRSCRNAWTPRTGANRSPMSSLSLRWTSTATRWPAGPSPNTRSARHSAGPQAQGAVAVPRIYRKHLRLLSLPPYPFGTGVGSLPNQRPLGSSSVRQRPGLPYKFLSSMYLAAETRLWPDLS